MSDENNQSEVMFHEGHPERVRLTWNPMTWMRWLYEWVVGWAEKPGGTVALGAISFCESSFFPIPPDPLMWAMSIGNRRKAIFFATVTTITSVLGAVFGWILGAYLFSEVVLVTIQTLGLESSWFGSADAAVAAATPISVVGQDAYPGSYLYAASELFEEWGFMALFGAAVSPIPFKVATVSSGIFELSLWTVIFGSLLGRGLRFYLFGILFALVGDRAKRIIDKHFNILSLAFVALAVLGVVAVKYVL